MNKRKLTTVVLIVFIVLNFIPIKKGPVVGCYGGTILKVKKIAYLGFPMSYMQLSTRTGEKCNKMIDNKTDSSDTEKYNEYSVKPIGLATNIIIAGVLFYSYKKILGRSKHE